MNDTRQALAIAPAPSTALTVQDALTLGEVFAKSGFFKDATQAAQAVVKILKGQELGIGPVTAMQGIEFVQGRISMSAGLVASLIQRSGRFDYRVTRLDNEQCDLEFVDRGAVIGTSSFSAADASAAGLSGPNWTKYRRNMLFARAMTNGARWYCASVFHGPVFTAEELGAEVTVDEDGVIELVSAPAPRQLHTVTPAQVEQASLSVAPVSSAGAPAAAAMTTSTKHPPLPTRAAKERLWTLVQSPELTREQNLAAFTAAAQSRYGVSAGQLSAAEVAAWMVDLERQRDAAAVAAVDGEFDEMFADAVAADEPAARVVENV